MTKQKRMVKRKTGKKITKMGEGKTAVIRPKQQQIEGKGRAKREK